MFTDIGTVIFMLTSLKITSTNRIVQDLLQDYDPHSRPFHGSSPVNVSVQLYINSLDSVNEINMDYKVKMYLRMQWEDPRLVYSNKFYNHLIDVDATMYEKFWSPDPFFINEKSGSFHKVSKHNQMMKITPDGKTTSSMRLSVTLSCPMNLHMFPMDYQACPMEFESFAYDSEDLDFHWFEDSPVQVNEYIDDYGLVPEFDLLQTTYTRGRYTYTVGSYPFLRVTFHLRRRFGYYFFSIYFPSLIVVLVSWIAFWIDIKAVPGRICIGFITVLTIVTQYTGIQSSLPRVSYIKAVDVWMVVCLVMVSLALIEYAVAHATLISYGEIVTILRNFLSKSPRESLTRRPPPEDPAIRARRVDEVSRFLFPTVFFFFNIIYWLAYGSGGSRKTTN